MKLSELADQTGARVEGTDVEITGAAGLDEANEGHITFLANPKYTPRVNTTSASAIYLAEDVKTEKDISILRVKDPYLAYTRALRIFYPEKSPAPFIHPTAVIDPSARVSKRASIAASVVIGQNVEIAEGVCIHPNVTIYEDVSIGKDSVIHSGVAVRERTVIGERVIIHNNAVIGCDGFGYAKDEEKHWLKIPQAGRVVLEDDVEVGAGTTIDSLLCSQVGLAGSSHIGSRVILAGQAGVAGHLTIGDDAVLTAKSATSNDIPPGKVISGIPAFDNRDWLRSTAAFRRLGEMQRTVRELERRLKSLEETKSQES